MPVTSATDGLVLCRLLLCRHIGTVQYIGLRMLGRLQPPTPEATGEPDDRGAVLGRPLH